MSAILTGLAMAAPEVIKGVGKALNPTPKMKTSNETTAYLNKLRKVSKEGLYGEDVKGEISADIAQASNQTRSAIRGDAVNQGIENSGVVAQQLIKEGGQTTLQAAKIAKKIAQLNKESKIKAGEEAARVSQAIQDRNYQNALARRNDRLEAFGSVVDGFSAGYSGFKQAKVDRLKEIAEGLG